MTRWRALAVGAAVCSVTMASCASHEPGSSKAGENIGQATQDLVVNCKYLDISQYPPLPVPVDFDHELVIRDLHVVEDPCRTTWTPTVACASGTVGVWTFGQLMTDMAGTTPPEQFVAEWISTFESPQTVNTFPVPPRGNVRAALIDPWLVASGCHAGDPIVGPGACPLDLKKAPFRLLAIVNRADLSGPAYGSESPGEARFVFGMLQLPAGGKGGGGKGAGAPPAGGSGGISVAVSADLAEAPVAEPLAEPLPGQDGLLAGDPLKGTVILEYRIPPSQKLFDWVNAWHNLTPLHLDDPAFNDRLQEITDAFTRPDLDPSRPNKGNSIGQVRTNEIDLGNDGIWELREFTLQDVSRGFDGFALLNDTTKQTPDDSVNNHTALDAWVIANEPAIMDVDHNVPLDFMGVPFLGGVSRETFFVWEPNVIPTSGPVDPLARHHFALSTCNGCHTNATNTPFTQIANRSIGSMAALSGFLGAPPIPSAANDGTPDPGTIWSLPDELTSDPRDYHEPWRRVCEETRILWGDPDPYTRGNGGVH